MEELYGWWSYVVGNPDMVDLFLACLWIIKFMGSHFIKLLLYVGSAYLPLILDT